MKTKYPARTIAGVSSILFAAGAVFVLGFFGGAPAAHAADCSITPADIAQIAAIQNDQTLGYSDETKAELALRKQLVGQTIGCAQKEVKMLQASLASTTAPDSAKQLQSQLAGDLNQASGFYNGELQQLNVVGVAGTKDIAQNVLAWRASTFLPLGENVNNFILWAQNQHLFNTAQSRMTQTEHAVSFLENATPDPTLQAALNDAQSSFNDAQSENAQAQTALTENLSPDQTLAFIKQSLASLSDTYQGFSNVSTLISKALPQGYCG